MNKLDKQKMKYQKQYNNIYNFFFAIAHTNLLSIFIDDIDFSYLTAHKIFEIVKSLLSNYYQTCVCSYRYIEIKFWVEFMMGI